MAEKEVAESSQLHDADKESKASMEAVIRRLLLPIQQQLDDVVQRLERLEAGGGGPAPSPSSSALSSDWSFKNSSNGQEAQSGVNSPAVRFSDTTAKVKKKMKGIRRKPAASGTTSDLYIAYKGPEEKKENIISSEVADNISTDPVPTDSLQGESADRWQRGVIVQQKGLIPSPHTPLQMMHKAEKKYEVGKVTDEEEAKQRQLRAILNKLTPRKFGKLFQQVKAVKIDNEGTVSGVIAQIFDKALMEPTFCEMYANFYYHLARELPDFSANNEKITFKRLLLNKCQEEFERGESEQKEADKADEEGEVKQTAEEREEKRVKARRRMLGNIRLLGELYKKKMLTDGIMHECINTLLGQYQNPDEEDVEALCKLMSRIGEIIDHPKAKDYMDAYFERMKMMSNNMKLSSRVRFMLRDAIDLRKNSWHWQQRRKVVLR